MGFFSGHRDCIVCLATLPNTPVLATGSLDKSIKLWDIQSKALMLTLTKHTGYITALCYMQVDLLVSGSSDRYLMVWDLDTKVANPPPRHVLIGHKSAIEGIIRLSKEEVLTGEFNGNLPSQILEYR